MWRHGRPADVRPAELGQLALDLCLDVQRRLAGTKPAMIASQHQLADLRTHRRVGSQGAQAGELLVYVDRCFPTPLPHEIARLEELADLGVACASSRGRIGRGLVCTLAVERQAAAAVVPPGPAASNQGDNGHDQPQSANDPDNGLKCGLHEGKCCAWSSAPSMSFRRAINGADASSLGLALTLPWAPRARRCRRPAPRRCDGAAPRRCHGPASRRCSWRHCLHDPSSRMPPLLALVSARSTL